MQYLAFLIVVLACTTSLSSCLKKNILQTSAVLKDNSDNLEFLDFQCLSAAPDTPMAPDQSTKSQIHENSKPIKIAALDIAERFKKLKKTDLRSLKLEDFTSQIQAYQWAHNLTPGPLSRNAAELLSRELLKLSQNYEFSTEGTRSIGYFDFPFLKNMNTTLSYPVTDYVTRIYDRAAREVCDASKPCCMDTTKVSYKSLILSLAQNMDKQSLAHLEENIHRGAMTLLDEASGFQSPIKDYEIKKIQEILNTKHLRPRLAIGRTLAKAKLAARFARTNENLDESSSLNETTPSHTRPKLSNQEPELVPELESMLRQTLIEISKTHETLKDSALLQGSGALSAEAFNAIRKNADDESQTQALIQLIRHKETKQLSGDDEAAAREEATRAIQLFKLLAPLEMPYFFKAAHQISPSEAIEIAKLRQKVESLEETKNLNDKELRSQAMSYLSKLDYVSEINFSGKTFLASNKFPNRRLAVISLDLIGVGTMVTQVHTYWIGLNPLTPLPRMLKGAESATYDLVSLFERNMNTATLALQKMCKSTKGICDETSVYASGDDIIGVLWLNEKVSTTENVAALNSALMQLKSGLHSSQFGTRVQVRASASLSKHPGLSLQALESALTSLHLGNELLFTEFIKPAENSKCKDQIKTEKVVVKDIEKKNISVQNVELSCSTEKNLQSSDRQ